MRIGLISDTHVPGGATEVPPQVATAFEGVDLILHAGNIYRDYTLDWLERIAPVKAAGAIYGDRMETPTAHAMECAGDPRVSQQQIMELEGHTVGVVNNLLMDGFSDELLPGIIEAHHLPEGKLPVMVEEYFGAALDIVVFGRTLHTLVEEHQGLLFVNPGSPSLPRQMRRLGSVAILELTPGGRDARVVDLRELS